MNLKNNYQIASSLFRVYISIHIFKKYLSYFFNKELIYGTDSFVFLDNNTLLSFLNINSQVLRNSSGVIISLILLFSIFFCLGIGKRLTCSVLYILLELIQRMNGFVLNGGDNFLKFILLYMIFINSYSYFTLFKKNKKVSQIDETLSFLGLLSIKIHLCLIYFVSAIYKMNAKVWFSGVANYYILNLERFMGFSFNISLAKNSFFVTMTTYMTLFWELSFPYLVWVKKTRASIISIGILMHLGIYVLMMIHDFEILFIATYILFFKDNELILFYQFVKQKLNHASARLYKKNY